MVIVLFVSLFAVFFAVMTTALPLPPPPLAPPPDQHHAMHAGVPVNYMQGSADSNIQGATFGFRTLIDA